MPIAYPPESYSNPLSEDEFSALRKSSYKSSQADELKRLRSFGLNLPKGTRISNPRAFIPEEDVLIPVNKFWRPDDSPRTRKFFFEELADNPYSYENWGEDIPLDFTRKINKDFESTVGKTFNDVLKESSAGTSRSNKFSTSFLKSDKFKKSAITASLLFGGMYAYSKFSGRDDDYNTIEGLHPGGSGLGAQSLKQNSDFGSGWDPMRRIAKEVFGDNAGSFNKLISTPEFKESLRTGIKAGGEELGEAGLQGYVKSHKALFEYQGKKYPFEFAAKYTHEKKIGDLVSTEATKAEIKSLSELGGLNAPSLYASGEDIGISNAVLMEKFNVKEGLGVATKEQSNELVDFMTRAHQKGITHTDLHAGNVLNVLDETGKERIGVIDWGMANRFERSAGVGAHQAGTGAHHFAVNLLKEKAPGMSMHEYSQLSDIARSKAYSLQKTEKDRLIAANSLNVFYAGAEKAMKEETLDVVVEAITTQKKSSNLSPRISDVLPISQGATNIRKRLSDTQDLAHSKTQIDTAGSDKTMLMDSALPPQKTIAERKRTIKRITNFNNVSTKAVGLGNRSFHNASKKHSRFSTLG